MLKITAQWDQDAIQLILEGRLAGPWVTELERVWQNVRPSEKGAYTVDLSGVTFIEEMGTELLRRMWREGAALVATGCCNRIIVEGITGPNSEAPSDRCRRA